MRKSPANPRSRPRSRSGGGWLAAARDMGPVLVILPLAAFAGVWLLGAGPSGATEGSGAVSSIEAAADGLRASFALCAGHARQTCVVDGDTLWFEGTKIRVADIDAPEVSRPGCAAEAQMGAAATARFMALLNAGPFTLAPDPASPDTDRYGRALRLVTRDGASLGAVLVDEGLAERWGGPRVEWC